MPVLEAIRLAIREIASHKLRSFFTLLGIIVSVGFLVAVVAIIQGMNAYVQENIAGAIVGKNAFQIRRTPISLGLIDDEEWRELQRRPRIEPSDAEYVRRAVPDAAAVAMQSGWPTPLADVRWRNRTVGDVAVFGVTPPFHVVQDYEMDAGDPLTEIDVRDRRRVAILGHDVADKLFDDFDAAIGRKIRVAGTQVTVKGIVKKKGTVLGQSWDGFVMLPLTLFETIYGRRLTTVISVKMAEAHMVADAMVRAEGAMRVAHRLRPGEENDFTVDAAEGLIAFWEQLTKVIFTVVPAVVVIGVVVGGIVIMNIMLMSVHDRTREIGIRKSVGAQRRDILRQFLAEAITLATLGGILGAAGGGALAALIATISPLPARVTPWSIGLALALGVTVGTVFGVFPATRASKLDPVTAMRAE